MILALHPVITALWILSIASQFFFLVLLQRQRQSMLALDAYVMLSVMQNVAAFVAASLSAWNAYEILDWGCGFLLHIFAAVIAVSIAFYNVEARSLRENFRIAYGVLLALAIIAVICNATSANGVVRSIDQFFQLWVLGMFLLAALFTQVSGLQRALARGFLALYVIGFALACVELRMPKLLTLWREATWIVSILTSTAIFAYWSWSQISERKEVAE